MSWMLRRRFREKADQPSFVGPSEYLERRRRQVTRDRYRAAYVDGSHLERDLEGWDEEGMWPDE